MTEKKFACYTDAATAKQELGAMPELEVEVAARLRAIMAAFHIENNVRMAEICETSKSAVNNWLLCANLPRVPQMILLCEQTGITLDWLYRGTVNLMDTKLANALNRIAATKI